MRYVLVTGWPRHWDKIANKTSFTYSMLHGKIMNPDNIIDHTPTVFIKTDRLGLVEKCWEGEVYGKKRTEDKVWFEFRLDHVIPCPPQYASYRAGWWVDESA
jgi:hypothetical protein